MKPKSLAVAIQKGGVGKTTIATHLAWYLAEKGHSVLFIDMDSQANSTSSIIDSSELVNLTASQLFAKLPDEMLEVSPTPGKISLIRADALLVDLDSKGASILEVFNDQARAVASKFDYLLLDVGPSVGNRMLASLLPVDAVLSPIEPERYAIDGVKDMIATFRQVRNIKANANRGGSSFPEMRFLGIFLTKVTRSFPRHKATVQALAETYGQLILPKYLPTRSAVGEAQGANLPVWGLGTASSREAGKEMREACEFIIEKLGEQP